MSGYISLNGKLHPFDTPILTIANRGFRYGDALFETIKCVNGIPLFLEAHLQRLYAGLEALEYNWNDQLLKTLINEEIQRLLIRNRHREGARVRVTVFRNNGGYYSPTTNDISILLESESSPNGYTLNKDGSTIGIYDELFKPIHAFNALKSANALLFVKAGIAKTKVGLDDLIILNSKGLICETISSNIFMVIHNRLITPPLSEGCLPGIMRQNILALAPTLGVEVLETPVGVNAFEQAEEVFTSNSISGVNWVRGYGKKRYFHKVSEKIINELNRVITI
ncbi:MAG: branched-subunit amino acid aminotransferase/4-amino-4-deoxychorismate lyase [Salibacteraceae bacterium]|jgi:branched-chain amino acid aminotransferase